MRFKIDENLPAEIGAEIRALGHEADTVTEEGLSGAPDSAILAHVAQESRVLLTMDKGIADVRIYRPQDYPGIVLLRPRTSGKTAVLDFVRRQLPAILQVALAGRLCVASDRGIRVR